MKPKWRLTGKTILQDVWVWNGSVVEFIKGKIHGYSLNICAGKNPICDVNLDLDPKDRSILKGDMRLLPFETNTFDTVISDPPWKIGYYERFRPFFEAVRVCKVGGIIIYNATWIPMTPSGDAERIETIVRQDKNFTNASIISIFKKVKANPTYEAIIEKEKLDAAATAEGSKAEAHE
jgi:hypothetical protein